MKNFYTIYSSGNSFFHKWSAPLKILALLFFIFSIAFLKNYFLILLASIISLILILYSSIKMIYFIHRLKNFFFLILALSILLLISAGGEILWKINIFSFSIKIYRDGLNLAILIILRAFCIFMIFHLLLSSTKINAILHSLIFLRIPQNIALIFFLTYRYILRYFDDQQKMKTAILLKGYNGRKKQFLTISRLYANLLIRSYEDTDRLFKAMILRGLTEKRRDNIKFKYNLFDIILFYLFTMISIILIILDKVMSKIFIN